MRQRQGQDLAEVVRQVEERGYTLKIAQRILDAIEVQILPECMGLAETTKLFWKIRKATHPGSSALEAKSGCVALDVSQKW